MLDTEARENTILLLAPVGQDALVTSKVLSRSGIRSRVCGDLHELCERLGEGYGAAFIAEEGLTPAGIGRLNQTFSMQPPWSDIPVLLVTGGRRRSEASLAVWRDFAVAGNVTLLERPIRTAILTSAAHVALRARRRQYQMRRLFEEQRDATALRDEFISMASHELKNPISSLKLQLQLNRKVIAKAEWRSVPVERVWKLIDTLESLSERLNRLVDDMLDVSRIQARSLHLEPRPTDLTSTIEDIAERFLPRLSSTGNVLRLDLDPEVKGIWDPFRIEQVLINLLTNAQRYAPNTPITLTLRRQGERVEIRVRDQGPGIAAADLDRIFRRFERADDAHKVAGLGLGLFICRQLVEAHGGGIHAESEPGKGATFVIDLPMKVPVYAAQDRAREQSMR